MEMSYNLQKRATRYAILYLESEIYNIKRYINLTCGTGEYDILSQNLIQYESELRQLREFEENY